MDWVLLTAQFLNGLQLGLLLFLMAAGLTLVFGIMDLVNLAHGSLYMIGAFICATLVDLTGSFLLGIVLTIPAMLLVGIVIEVVVLRTLYARNHLDQVLATFGLILFFDAAVHLVWGPQGLVIPIPGYLAAPVYLAEDIVIPLYRIMIIVVGLAVAVALYGLVGHTRMGMLIRAGASNRRMAGALGVDIKRLFTLVFGLGAVLAGLAGLMWAPIVEASIGMGNDILISAFVVVVIGGIGSIRGAFVAALLIGLIDTLGRSYIDVMMTLVLPPLYAETAAPALSAMLSYILMAAILFFRPQGLFPPRVR